MSSTLDLLTRKMTRELGSDREEERAMICGSDVWKLGVRLKRPSPGHFLLEAKSDTRWEIFTSILDTVTPALWNFLPSCQRTFRNEIDAHCPGCLT